MYLLYTKKLTFVCTCTKMCQNEILNCHGCKFMYWALYIFPSFVSFLTCFYVETKVST